MSSMRTLNLPQGASLTDQQFSQSAIKTHEQQQRQKQYETELLIALVIIAPIAVVILTKLWGLRGAAGSALIYLLGRGYKLKKRTSASFSSLAERVKEAAEK